MLQTSGFHWYFNKSKEKQEAESGMLVARQYLGSPELLQTEIFIPTPTKNDI